MRVLGVDLDIQCGDNNSMAICTIDNSTGYNKVVSIHIGEIKGDIDKMAKTLISIFEINNCDYIAFNGGGILTPVSSKIKETLGDRVKDDFMNIRDIHSMMTMLQNDNVLKRVGLELKTRCVNAGLLALDTNVYEDFELSMVYAIGIANRILNIESIKEEKEDLKEELNEAKKIVKELQIKLEEMAQCIS